MNVDSISAFSGRAGDVSKLAVRLHAIANVLRVNRLLSEGANPPGGQGAGHTMCLKQWKGNR